jgi:hypothetical protein
VWFHFEGAWMAVPPPPRPGPYIWNGNVWVVDPAPPPIGARWVDGHWTPNGWIPGHWAKSPPPRPGANWVPGHWSPRGKWVPGHWR